MDTSLVILILAINTAISVLVLVVLQSRLGRLRDIESQFNALGKSQEKIEKSVREEITRYREEAGGSSRQLREEINTSLKMLGDSLSSRLSDIAQMQNTQLESFSGHLSRLTQSNEQKLDRMRDTIEEKISLLQRDNNEKLEKMRLTVDEKLHATLEQRLGESFKLVSERLEMVHKGLGEMQSLAAGVGDLKKVLSNVKTRGIWGEISLANLLEQVFTVEQYEKNVATKNGSSERVEFAIKLPGRDPERQNIWLPIDAKFPQEDYQKLIEAQEQANAALADQASRQLEARIKGEAKSIRDKYIDPPGTTDFAIMFLPTEGLFAEVIRRPGLCDLLLRDYRVVITGPTTLTALLSSLQIGFRTLTIEKRSSEVWALLGAVKTEFGKFSEVLEKTYKKLQEASSTIDTAARKSRTIERKLKGVQELPASEAAGLLEEEK